MKNGDAAMKRGKAILAVLGLALAVGVVFAMKKHAAAPADLASPPAAAVDAAHPRPRLVDLGATKCIPCKLMAPILEDLSTSLAGRLQVEFIDVWEKPAAAEPYHINLIPTQIFIAADGRELFRHEGFFSKEDILAKWKELGVDLAAPEDNLLEKKGTTK